MIEVFKTNVTDAVQANMLVSEIQIRFEGYLANFDLEDCDLILRVENPNGSVAPADIISLLEKNGYKAAVLEDLLSFFV